MATGRKMVSAGFSNQMIPEGSHICLIYKDEETRRRITSQFLSAGINADEKVGYFAEEMALELDSPQKKQEKSFRFYNNMDVYCPDKMFIVDRMLENIRHFYNYAVKENYNGARVSGVMSWALQGVAGADKLMRYESSVNDVLQFHPITAICQYDANLFSREQLTKALETHPLVIYKGKIIENPDYKP